MDAKPPSPASYKVQPYRPANPNGPFPYAQSDLTPMDPSSDTAFYSQPRFVTHIDDNAIDSLKQYYDAHLAVSFQTDSSSAAPTKPPQPIRILDICSSWISHYPPRIVKAASIYSSTATEPPSDTATDPSQPSSPIHCYGTGLNASELSSNPILNPTASGRGRDGEPVAEKRWWVQDLNAHPTLSLPDSLKASLHPSPPSTTANDNQQQVFHATTCTVSIDYLTNPVSVLSSILQHTLPGGTVHLAISNRCFPTKAVRRWLQISEQERLEMVGDYLWWSGWRDIEIVEVVDSGGGGRWGSWKDPLWVVRARKGSESSGEETSSQ